MSIAVPALSAYAIIASLAFITERTKRLLLDRRIEQRAANAPAGLATEQYIIFVYGATSWEDSEKLGQPGRRIYRRR